MISKTSEILLLRTVNFPTLSLPPSSGKNRKKVVLIGLVWPIWRLRDSFFCFFQSWVEVIESGNIFRFYLEKWLGNFEHNTRKFFPHEKGRLNKWSPDLYFTCDRWIKDIPFMSTYSLRNEFSIQIIMILKRFFSNRPSEECLFPKEIILEIVSYYYQLFPIDLWPLFCEILRRFWILRL